ncbi:hypothetical protein AAMO2058_000204900 [Amorphochlora amoebiformis]
MSTRSQTKQLKVIKDADLAKHCSKDDLWCIIHGKVYDISQYVERHPGGIDILIDKAAGADASEAFEEIQHSEDARRALQKYVIGFAEGSAEEDWKKLFPNSKEEKKAKCVVS